MNTKKDLLRDYSEGDSKLLNDRIQQNLAMRQNAGAYLNRQSSADAAYYYNEAPTDNVQGMQLSDFWHKYYNDMQESQITRDNNRINRAEMNKSDAALIMHYLYPETISDEDFYNTYGIDRSQARDLAQSRLDALRQNGVWTNKQLPDLQSLIDIQTDSDREYNDAIQSREINKRELQESLDNYDISQYFTKKANESTTTFGNFLYKLPGLFGGSHSDWAYQLSSMASGAITAVAADALLGASMAGTPGAVAGGLRGLARGLTVGLTASAASQVGGGIQARKGESDIEAYSQYEQNLSKILEEDKIDTDRVIKNVKKQLASRGENSNISDEEALELAANGTIDSDSNQFEDARRRAYRGIPRLYERNMALGAGEVATDMLFYVPFFRNSQVFRGVLNPMEGAFALGKKAVNPIKSLLSRRAAANADVARAALTGKELSRITRNKALKSWGAAQLANMYEEATEEGAQYIMADKAGKGEFDDQSASGSFWNALTNGQLFDDMSSNWLDRQRSTIAVFTPFDPIYSNDAQLQENYMSGAILSSLDPRALVMSGKDLLVDVHKQMKNDKRFGDIFQRALEEQDFVDRSVDLLQTMRDLKANGKNYGQVLDNISEALKTGKYDLGVISDAEGETTEEQIDNYINEERNNVNQLLDTRARLSEKTKSLGLSERDSDIYTAIANNIRTNIIEQNDKKEEARKEFNRQFDEKSKESSLFSDVMYNVIQNAVAKHGIALEDSQIEGIHKLTTQLAKINQQLNSIERQSQQLSNQAYGAQLLKKMNMSYANNSVAMAELQGVMSSRKAKLLMQKRILQDQIAEQLEAFGKLNELNNTLELYNSELEVYNNLIQQARESEEGYAIGSKGQLLSIPYLEGKINQAQKNIESQTGAIDRFKQTTSDIVTELSNNQISDSDVNAASDNYIAELNDLDYFTKLYEPFEKGDKSTKSLIEKYKDRVRTQSQERDDANSDSNGQTVETTQEFKARTDEELENQLNDSVNTLIESLNNAVSNTELQKFVNRLTNGLNTISSAAGKVSYVNRSLDKFTKQLEKMPKDSFTEEDQKVYNELKTIAAQAKNIADEINKRASDRAYNAKRNTLTLPIDTQEWSAPDGKKYKFLPRSSEFSIDEGGIIKAMDVTDTSDIDNIRKHIKDLKNDRKKIVKQLANDSLKEDEIKDLQNQLQTTNNHIQNLEQDLLNAQTSKIVEFRLNQDQDYLSKLQRTDNKGKTITFEGKLKNIQKAVDAAIESANKKREDSTEEGTVEEVPDSTSGTQDLTPEYAEKAEITAQENKKRLKCHAYAFTGTKSGVTAANRLMDPYNQSSQWRGYVTVQKWEEVQDYDFANKKSEKGSKIKWDRPAAYKTYERILRLTKGKTKEEIFNLFNQIKSGKHSTITKAQYQNMVRALPINTVLFNGRVRTVNGTLIPTRLVMPDETSRNRENVLSELEFNLRENMIMNLAQRQKDDSDAQPTLNIKEGSVRIYMRTFLQNTRDEANPNNPLLYDENDELVSRQQINDIYDNHVQTEKVQQNVNIDNIIDIVKKYGYNVDNLPETITVNEQEYGTINYLLRGISELGDSVILPETFIKSYIKPIFGLSSDTKKAGNNQKLANSIVEQMLSESPNLFMNYNEDGGQSLNTEAQVEDALQNRWKIRLPIKLNGEQLVLDNRTRDEIIEICQQIEDDIKNYQSVSEFIDNLNNRGLSFNKSTERILKDYFINRKFNRLTDPSNIIHVLTSNDSVPVGNSLISYRRKQVINSNIDEVQALGLIYDETSGKFYYSKDKYRTYIDKLRNKEQDEDTEDEDLLTVEQKQVEDSANNALSILNGRGKLSDKISQLMSAYDTDYQTVLNDYNKSFPNQPAVKRQSKAVVEWFIEQQKEKQLSELYQKYADQEEDIEDVIEDAFEGKDSEPLVLAYATANGTIMRFDTHSRKMESVKGATGTAGSVYLLLPSFFNPNRQRLLVKLNPGKIDINIARIIADLMVKVADGSISEEQMINSGMNKNLKVDKQISVGEFIRNFMYYGTEAIERNPSNHNLDRLVYIKDGRVYFGNTLDGKGTEVTTDNIEEFANWIATTKNYRIDKDKLSSDSGLVQGSFTILDDSGNIVYEQVDGDNYISQVVNSGFVKTDMSTKEDSTIFGGNPNVYFEFNDVFEGMTEENTKTTTKKKDSAEKAKTQIKKTSKRASTDDENVKIINEYKEEIKQIVQDTDPDTLFIKINGKNYEVDFDNNGSVYNPLQFDNKLATLAINNKPITIEIIADGESKVILSYNQEEETPAKPAKPAKQKATTQKADKKVESKNKNKLQPLIIPKDQTDPQKTFDQIQKYYDDNKDKLNLSDSFVDDTYEDWMNNSSDEEDYVVDLTNPNPTASSNPDTNGPGLGITPDVQDKKQASPLFDLTGNVVDKKGEVKTETKTDKKSEKLDDKQIDKLLENITEDTIQMLILLTPNYDSTDDVSKRINQLKETYTGLITDRYPNNFEKVAELFQNSDKIGAVLKNYDNKKKDSESKLEKAVVSFFKNFVRMEDADKAINTAKKILGEDFDFSIDNSLPFRFDAAKHAMVYVYGVCTSNGIRLFRDAKKNKIKRGVAYHEAFHRVSMLLMPKNQRQAMYEALIDSNPSFRNKSEREKQEYLADEFAEFVLRQNQDNSFYKFFNRIYQSLNKLINRLYSRTKRNGINSLNSIFNDIYQGKYAYTEVSQENKEYFDLVFGYDPLFSGYKYDGVEIATTQQQFNDIYRNILASIIRSSGITTNEAGITNIDYKQVKKYWEDEAKTAEDMVKAVLKSGEKDKSVLVAALNYQKVTKGIVTNWKSWEKYMKRAVRMNFSLNVIDDANDLDFSDYEEWLKENEKNPKDESGMTKTIQNDDSIVAAYMRNQYKSLDADIRLFLYTITDDTQLTPEGLQKYTNVYQLWHELCHTCQQAKDVDDMISILKKVARQQKRDGQPQTIKQVVDILEDPETTEQLKARLFGNVVKYVNNFIFMNYRINDKGGIEASIEDSNQNKRNQTAKNKWKQSMIDVISGIEVQLDQLNEKDRQKFYIENVSKKARIAVLNGQNVAKVLEFFGLDIDATEVDKMLSKLDRKEKDKLLASYNGFLLKMKNSLFAKQLLTSKQEISSIVNDQFNPDNNTLLFLLMEQLASEGLGSAKNDTVRIAGGATAYIIGQYNHVTRFFNRLIFNNDFIKRFTNNPYTKEFLDGKKVKYRGSKWLSFIAKKNYPILRTFVGTVNDSDYFNSNDFLGITGTEDMLNRFTTALSNYHSIPELANKKTQYIIDSIPMEECPIQKIGYKFMVTQNAVDTFRGYFRSELEAIREAYIVRDNFVNAVNKATGKKYTAESISAMNQEEQEALFKRPDVAPLLVNLRLAYHYSKKGGDPIKNPDGTFTVRNFGINLVSPKNNGYKSRHFNDLLDGFKISTSTTNTEIEQWLNRDEVKQYIENMLEWNIRQVLDFLDTKEIISGYNPVESLGQMELQNKLLPENVILDNKKINPAGNKKLSSSDIMRAVAYFVMNNMCDNLEFEKLVSGDKAQYKDIDAVNKRYSAQTSTVAMKNGKGTIVNAFAEDRLYDASEYRVIEVNTTPVDDLDKFKREAKTFLGVDAFDESLNVPETLDGKVKYNCLNYKKLLDSKGNLTPQAKKGELVQRYLEHRDQRRTYGVNEKGEPLTDEQLAKAVTDNAYIRLIKYRSIDPTDAQSWVSAEMYRQLKQRQGEWSIKDEYAYDLLEHYDELDVIKKINPTEYANMMQQLNIDTASIEDLFNKFKSGEISPKEYRGQILGFTRNYTWGSLKYVFFGNDANSSSQDIFKIYDKLSASPIFKIFADEHDMRDVYDLMKETQTDFMKMESCTKTGNIPSFELYDKDGKIDKEAFRNAPKQMQEFENFGKQLNTDPHKHNKAALLTQFMKVVILNTDRKHTYKLNGVQVKGDKLLRIYQQVLDALTLRGYKTFCGKFGIDPNTFDVNKEKFMSAVQDMASTQGATPEMMDALSAVDGEYVIHPSALPNINWIQSRIIALMEKTVIKIMTPGKPLFQVSSVGYDNILKNKMSADSKLKSYNEDGFMEVKLSISLFEDIIKEAGLQNESFDVQRQFLLDNQGVLFALSYRVPTQGQNSTIPIKIVDVFEPQRGDIIMFPSDITALTGSDFDIDKMFLSRPNVEIKDGKAQKIDYNLNNLLNHLNDDSVSIEQLQNVLLDIYFLILTNEHHRVDTVTPLDVTTDPLRAIKDDIDNLKGVSKDPRTKKGGWFLNPVFQIEQRTKNAGSSAGIGPMALNNVVRAFIQMASIKLQDNDYLNSLGLSLEDNGIPRIFDRNGESIVDSTSALINAFVDAVKDNYIGRMNVNDFTFDIVSMLISCGMGNDTYYLLGQPIICEVADNYVDLKKGQVGVDAERASGENYLQEIIKNYVDKLPDDYVYDPNDKATPEEMSAQNLRNNIKKTDSEEWYKQQIRYLNTFLYLKRMSGDYRTMVNAAQIDTGKYGISANDIIKFMQSHEQFSSEYNTTFSNPQDLFDKTFLGEKYDFGVKALFNIFSKVLPEFSPGYVNTIDKISKRYGIYGAYGKMQVKRFSQRLRTALLSTFFNAYIAKQFSNSQLPLKEFLAGDNTVVDRFNEMKQLAEYTNTGKILFDMLKPARTTTGSPKFFNVNSAVSDDTDIKANITQAWQELYESDDAKLQQYAKDLAVYMFFITGGTDTNASGLTKTSIFDLVPPRLLANLEVNGVTYNNYVENLMNNLSKPDSVVNDDIIEVAELMMAQFDDDFAKDISNSKIYNRSFPVSGDNNILIIKKGSNKLVSFSTGLYAKYVKVKNKLGLYDLYKIGDMITSKSADGNTYVNPVYYKIGRLGYRNFKFQAYAVRSDGYVQDGKVKSLLYESEDHFSNSQDIDLTLKENKKYETLVNKAIPVTDSMDFSQLLSKLGNGKADLATIDAADIVVYVDDGNASREASNMVKYGEFKDKQFIHFNSIKGKLNYPKAKVAVIGSASKEQMQKIIDAFPKNVQFLESAKPTGFVSPMDTKYNDENGNSPFSAQVLLITANNDDMQTADNKTTNNKTSNIITETDQKNLTENGKKREKECK